jgi:hypothetical protein
VNQTAAGNALLLMDSRMTHNRVFVNIHTGKERVLSHTESVENYPNPILVYVFVDDDRWSYDEFHANWLLTRARYETGGLAGENPL